MQRLLRTLLAAAALVLAPMAASAQTALYPGTLFTWADPVGLCNPPSVTSGCISKSMVSQGLEEVQAIEATLGTNLTGLNNRKYTLLSTADRTRLGIDLNTATPATAALSIPQFSGDPSSLTNGDIWLNGSTLKIRSSGLTYAFVPGGGGTVSSVDASVPASILSISGNPVTSTGTLAFSLINQNANKVWAGPSSGGDATPTFRLLVAADLPSIPNSLLDSDLAALGNNATNGLWARTATGTGSARTITGDSEIVVSNGDGVSGNPTLSIAAAITRDAEINVQGTSNELASSGSGVAPTLSIASTFRLGGKTHTAPFTIATATPGTCSVGDMHFDSDATAGLNVYGCTSSNTWTLEGDGGGGGGGSPHDLLDGTQNQDTLTGSVVLGDLIAGNSTPKWARVAGNTTTTKKFLSQTGNGSISATPAWAQPAESDLATTDITTNNVSSTKHGFAPKSPADATQFLNGATTPAYAAVKDSDLSTSDITTNNVSTSKHGFVPKAPNDATKFLDGTGAFSTPSGSGTVKIPFMASSANAIDATSIRYMMISGGEQTLETANNGALIQPVAGTYKNLVCFKTSGVETGTKTVTFLLDGTTPSSLTCTITSSSTCASYTPVNVTGECCQDTTHTASTSLGDEWWYKITPANTAITGLIFCSMEFDPS